MNIKRAKDEIKDTIEAYLLKDSHGAYAIPAVRQRPVLLIGPPGVGKTQIMEQIARECGIGLVSYTITHHTRQSAIGLPYIVKKTYGGAEYSVTEYTMSEIVASVYNKIEETGLLEGLLFIDEINCVSETLAPTMLQFLQCKSFGNHKIPEGWIIAAAGNPPEFNKSVRDFDVVTLDRIKMIHVEAEYDVWKEYAYQEAVHPAIISYLDVKKENFCRIETTVDGKRFATPRGWEDLSRLIEVYERIGKTVDREVIGQYIQYPNISKDFANYLELYNKYQNDYQVDEILAGTIRENLCNRVARAPFDEKLSVIGLLLAKLGSGFREVIGEEDFTELLQEQLKLVKAEMEDLENVTSDRVLELLKSRTEAFRVQWRQELEAGLLNRWEDYRRQDVIKELERYQNALIDCSANSGTEAWNRIKMMFDEQCGRCETGIYENGARLEHAFDFLEASFGDGQEMVIFITELNRNYFSVKYLEEYECERYYQYNQRLLFSRQEDMIAKRIENLGI